LSPGGRVAGLRLSAGRVFALGQGGLPVAERADVVLEGGEEAFEAGAALLGRGEGLEGFELAAGDLQLLGRLELGVALRGAGLEGRECRIRLGANGVPLGDQGGFRQGRRLLVLRRVLDRRGWRRIVIAAPCE
jgi:hypothetical protein